MANLKLYKEFFGYNNFQEIIKDFQLSLMDTNRSYSFYVDWLKVKKNIESINIELSLLDSLINSKALKTDFFSLLSKYPEVVKIIPVIIAVRSLVFSIINYDSDQVDTIKYSFKRETGEKLTNSEIQSYFDLMDKSGATQLFYIIKNFKDYVLGVEVGMDTNARKNRSGRAMEILLQPVMEKISTEYSLELFSQKQFKFVQTESEIQFSDQLQNKKFDMLFIKNNKAINVEVNYFDEGGSKQEIINSYINRQRILKEYGHQFILISDGQAWNRKINNELESGFEALDYVLNISFVKKGFLNHILKNFFELSKK